MSNANKTETIERLKTLVERQPGTRAAILALQGIEHFLTPPAPRSAIMDSYDRLCDSVSRQIREVLSRGMGWSRHGGWPALEHTVDGAAVGVYVVAYDYRTDTWARTYLVPGQPNPLTVGGYFSAVSAAEEVEQLAGAGTDTEGNA